MSIVSEEITKRIRQIEKEKAELEKRLQGVPEGKLRISQSKYGPRFYHVHSDGAHLEEYIHRGEHDLAYELARSSRGT